MRVRLINKFEIELARLDPAGTATASGYDPEFGETRVSLVDGVRTDARVEKALVRVPCQIEDETMNAIRMFDAGNSPQAKIGFVVAWKTLFDLELLDGGSGLPLLNVNDRLNAIYDRCGNLVHTVRTPPGLYCVEARPISYGIGGHLDLLLLRYNDRALSQTT